MRWKIFRFPLLFVVVASLLLGPALSSHVLSQAPTSTSAPTPSASTSDAPTLPRVYVGIYLHDISELSLSDGTYEIDVDLWAKWLGEFDPAEIRIANASEIETDVLATEADGEWNAARWRVRGTMRGDFPVHDFPLDRQAIRVQVELPRLKGELVPDLAGSGVSDQFSITDWIWSPEFRPVVTTERYPSDLGSITNEGLSSEVRRVSFEVPIERPLTPVVLKLFLPLAVVALIVFLSLFIRPKALQPRLTMCVTGLVAVFAFQFSITDIMPAVAYLTLADVLFITVYVLAIFCVFVAVMSHIWASAGHEERAERLQRVARVVSPIAMAIAVFFALPNSASSDHSPEPLVEEASLELPRHTSKRSVVRIGTTTPLRLSTSPVGFASFWGLSFRPDEGRAQPLMLQDMPRIDSDAMRFLSDGTLEVTWTLHDDARWSDGSRLRLEDLTRPLHDQPDPRIVSFQADEENHSLTIIWKERVIDALRAPAIWPTAHLDSHLSDQDNPSIRDFLGYALRPSVGPYMPVKIEDSKVTATRNPYFPLQEANIERVELYTFDDSNALRDALMQGDIDITTPNALSPGDYAHFSNHKQLDAVETSSANFLFLAPNLSEEPWDQADARRALLQAINRVQLTQNAWGDAGRVANAPTTDRLPETLSPVTYDPGAARETFERLGLLDARVKVHWSTPTSERFVTQLAEDLSTAGLTVELVRVPSTWPLWLSKDYEGLVVHQLRIEQSTPIATWWGLPFIDGRIDMTQRHNAFSDATAALLIQYEHALFRERRAQLRGRIFKQWHEMLPLLPIAFTGERIVLDRGLRGWERAAGSAFGTTMDQWYFE